MKYQFIGFNTCAYFNFVACKKHREEGMIDILNKKWQFDECSKIPCYNLPSEKWAVLCKAHKEFTMVNVLSKQCWFDVHSNIAFYYLPSKIIAIAWKAHKEAKMVDVYNQRCEFHNCWT